LPSLLKPKVENSVEQLVILTFSFVNILTILFSAVVSRSEVSLKSHYFIFVPR